ncbi:AMP-binding protein (plasmid) [Streptomyces sp. NBC_00715]|uniref:AMP-binding protein n=1 Tax=Streptomyces sp. NBC_00715 TaxID=2975811 RepID=UPI0038639E6A
MKTEAESTIVDYLLEHGTTRADHPVLILADERRITYGELTARVLATAERIREIGLPVSSRIGLWFVEGEWIDYAVGYFAALLSGAVAVVLPTDTDARTVRVILRDFGVGVVLCSPTSPLSQNGVTSVAVSNGAPVHRPYGHASGVMDPGSLADVIFTSGSTGAPKGVAADHGLLRRMADTYRGRTKGAATVAVGVSHSTAIGTRQLLLSAVARGSTLAVSVPFEPRSFLRLVAASSASTAVVPAAAGRALVRALQDDATLCPPGLRTLRLISDHLRPDTHRALAACLPGTRVINVYGLTEAGDAHLVTTEEDCHLGPGGWPAPGTEVAVMSDVGEWAGVGEEGNICLRDRLPVFSYPTDPAAGARTWREGWTITADLGSVDAAGRVSLTGRDTGLVRIGGRTVAVARVQAMLESIPGVDAAAVVALPHPTLGQSLAAVVAAPEGVDTDALNQTLADVLPGHAVLSPVVTVGALPLSRTGKPHQNAVLALIRQRLSASSRPCATPTELLVAGLWQQVLELDGPPGADANFFQLGGDSLTAVEVLAALESEIGIAVPMTVLFNTASAAECAKALDLLTGAS